MTKMKCLHCSKEGKRLIKINEGEYLCRKCYNDEKAMMEEMLENARNIFDE
ncbi:MAG: hypothetical protein GY861_09340 [bacterium]|nr:hypothetical protein [bacterium]